MSEATPPNDPPPQPQRPSPSPEKSDSGWLLRLPSILGVGCLVIVAAGIAFFAVCSATASASGRGLASLDVAFAAGTLAGLATLIGGVILMVRLFRRPQ